MFRSTIDDFIAKSIETDGAFLETCDPEREPVAFERAWLARTQGAIGEVHAFEPNYEGSPLVPSSNGEIRVSSAKGSHRFEARAGHHLAPAMLGSGANVYEALGPGFTLLALGADPDAVQAFRDAAAELNLPLAVVEDDAGGEAARYEATCVLVRPDQFVAWSTRQSRLASGEARRVLDLARGDPALGTEAQAPRV